MALTRIMRRIRVLLNVTSTQLALANRTSGDVTHHDLQSLSDVHLPWGLAILQLPQDARLPLQHMQIYYFWFSKAVHLLLVYLNITHTHPPPALLVNSQLLLTSPCVSLKHPQKHLGFLIRLHVTKTSIAAIHQYYCQQTWSRLSWIQSLSLRLQNRQVCASPAFLNSASLKLPIIMSPITFRAESEYCLPYPLLKPSAFLHPSNYYAQHTIPNSLLTLSTTQSNQNISNQFSRMSFNPRASMNTQYGK